ncbi:MAG: right-handed parallel beta-helix repeat-containing protein [Anaerolineae bacterium]
MTNEIRLAPHEATSAEAVQVLPAAELALDRGIELRSNVALVGQGRDTVLRKEPGRLYPLSGYHNYGMLDVPLMFTEGLKPGMTVAIRDEQHGGFFETFARITWVDGTWVGIDQGLHSDYHADLNPVLVTAFPLVFGLGVENVSVQSLTLDGNRDAQPAGIGACRGAAVYFLRSRGITISDVVESDFAGEGLGYQMCSHVDISDCHFAGNAGNGYHPGAGSTAASFENCIAARNDAAGFFFCVRANHITVRDCAFKDNRGPGVSVGTRDSHNLIEGCEIEGNEAPGVLFRETRRPVAMHSCRLARCHISGNARTRGDGQVAVLGDAHNLALVDNVIEGSAARETVGIYVAPTATGIWQAGNRIEGCFPALVAESASLAACEPEMACGIEAARPEHARHLPWEA